MIVIRQNVFERNQFNCIITIMNNHYSDAHTCIHPYNTHLVCKSKVTEHEHMIVSPSYTV